MHLQKYILTAATLLVLSLALVQCRKEKFTTSADDKLSFSIDTVFFDTVFTTVGTTTKLLKVYNPHAQSLRISRIALHGGQASPYRINVDGMAGPELFDVEILPRDSIFVFIEATLEPNNESFPFIVEDYIEFVTNGNLQTVTLLAWGRDAHFHGEADGFHVLPPGAVWNNDKPHVIYGIVAVDEGQVLTINPGTQVYVHKGGGIYVYKSKIVAKGNADQRITFQGDRLEPAYQNLPGQWGIQVNVQFQTGFGPEIASIIRGGLWLFQSTGSELDWVEIKNGHIGLQVDTTGTNSYALDMRHTSITNMSVFGLWAQGASVIAENNLMANCGQSCAALTIGGRYNFRHCTMANYWSGTRSAPAFVLNNYYEDINKNIQIRSLEEADFRNCIMYGNNATLTDFNEFVVDLKDETLQTYTFTNCLVDTDKPVNNDGLHWFGMRLQAPSFTNTSAGNFRPINIQTYMSSANSEGVFDDLDGKSRTSPDFTLGCYEVD